MFREDGAVTRRRTGVTRVDDRSPAPLRPRRVLRVPTHRPARLHAIYQSLLRRLVTAQGTLAGTWRRLDPVGRPELGRAGGNLDLLDSAGPNPIIRGHKAAAR